MHENPLSGNEVYEVEDDLQATEPSQNVLMVVQCEGGEGESQLCQTVKTVRTKVALKLSRLPRLFDCMEG